MSRNPNDIILDAFCGCGTALVAAQNFGRQCIGIDISPTACRVIARRLRARVRRHHKPGGSLVRSLVPRAVVQIPFLMASFFDPLDRLFDAF